jgi:hypothetical protein
LFKSGLDELTLEYMSLEHVIFPDGCHDPIIWRIIVLIPNQVMVPGYPNFSRRQQFVAEILLTSLGVLKFYIEFQGA